MSDVTKNYSLSGDTFSNGATVSGTYTVVYDAAGDIVSVSNVNLTASLDGETTTINALTAGTPVVADDGTTHYILTSSDPSGTLSGPFSGLDLVYNSESPTHLSVNTYDGDTTALQSSDSSGAVTTSNLVSGGGGTIATTCFCAGTGVTTPTGIVAIETLSIGDLITTVDGEIQPIRWIGRQTVSTRFADPLRVLPIRIGAGALGNNLPVRDLLVSSCHALLIDGVLVQAGALVNGMSIVRESQMPTTFVYYHVELADHALMLAEGVPAETFVDNVNRMGFDNWAEHEALGVDGAIVEMHYPRAQSARQVPQEIHSRLLMRAILMLPATEVAA